MFVATLSLRTRHTGCQNYLREIIRRMIVQMKLFKFEECVAKPLLKVGLFQLLFFCWERWKAEILIPQGCSAASCTRYTFNTYRGCCERGGIWMMKSKMARSKLFSTHRNAERMIVFERRARASLSLADFLSSHRVMVNIAAWKQKMLIDAWHVVLNRARYQLLNSQYSNTYHVDQSKGETFFWS